MARRESSCACPDRARPLHVDSGAEVLAAVDGIAAELFLDTEDLVELGKTLRTGWSTSLDLTTAKTNSDVSNGDILGLARTVRDHDTPSCAVGILGGLNGLGDGTDLVDLEEKGVASLGLDGLLDELWVGDSQVITVQVSIDRVSRSSWSLTRQAGSQRSCRSSSRPPSHPRRMGPQWKRLGTWQQGPCTGPRAARK